MVVFFVVPGFMKKGLRRIFSWSGESRRGVYLTAGSLRVPFRLPEESLTEVYRHPACQRAVCPRDGSCSLPFLPEVYPKERYCSSACQQMVCLKDGLKYLQPGWKRAGPGRKELQYWLSQLFRHPECNPRGILLR